MQYIIPYTLSSGVLAYILNNEQDKRTSNEIMLKNAYRFDEIRDLERRARNICKNITNSPCDEVKHYIEFSRVYSREKAISRKTLPSSYNFDKTISNDEMKDIEKYRTTFASYFTLTELLHPLRPGSGDLISFLTFHWSIYMANNIAAEINTLSRPYNTLGHVEVYDKVLKKLDAQNRQEYVKILREREEFKKSLLLTRDALFLGTESMKGIPDRILKKYYFSK